MAEKITGPERDTGSQAAKRPWVSPEIRRIEAGSAETSTSTRRAEAGSNANNKS